jgi:diguanylate cyclase (GGDEF)-like protein
MLLVEHGRWSSQRSSKRVERRMIMTVEQATLHASMALGRAILTDRIRVAAETDALTNVANRRTFNEALDRAVLEANTAARPFALVLVDLDHFKRINDTYGHQAGDDVLRHAAAALRTAAGDGDLTARYGGEEFAVIIRLDTVAELAEVAERLRRAVADSSGDAPVTASLGAAMCPLHARDAHTLTAAADAALYEAKRGGRDRVVIAAASAAEPPGVAVAREVRS